MFSITNTQTNGHTHRVTYGGGAHLKKKPLDVYKVIVKSDIDYFVHKKIIINQFQFPVVEEYPLILQQMEEENYEKRTC